MYHLSIIALQMLQSQQRLTLELRRQQIAAQNQTAALNALIKPNLGPSPPRVSSTKCEYCGTFAMVGENRCRSCGAPTPKPKPTPTTASTDCRIAYNVIYDFETLRPETYCRISATPAGKVRPPNPLPQCPPVRDGGQDSQGGRASWLARVCGRLAKYRT